MSAPHCPDRKELARVSETGPSPHTGIVVNPTGVCSLTAGLKRMGQSPVATGKMCRSLAGQGVNARCGGGECSTSHVGLPLADGSWIALTSWLLESNSFCNWSIWGDVKGLVLLLQFFTSLHLQNILWAQLKPLLTVCTVVVPPCSALHVARLRHRCSWEYQQLSFCR